ncbi:MAG: NADPH:quinone reductase [Nitrospinota bacterium]|nr:NADPH:quinone reductase [Nitrospinota bacterium]
MKAIQVNSFGEPSVMKLGEIDDPIPSEGEILIEVKGAGVNPVDTTFRSGAHPLSKGLKLPWIPGIDASGKVVAVGEGVENFKNGDRVFGNSLSGSYAELSLLSAHRSAILPDNFDFIQGASFPCVLYTAYYALVYKASIKPGETVLIHGGAGGVGSMAIQIAKTAGANVFCTVSSQEKAEFCKGLGADNVFNYHEEDWVSKCIEKTSGRGVDSIIEMVASENFDSDCQAVKKFGTIVLLGSGTGKQPSGTVTYPPFYSKDIDVRGMSLFNSDCFFSSMTNQLEILLRDGKIRSVVGEVLDLSDAPRAHEILMTGSVFGKIVLSV